LLERLGAIALRLGTRSFLVGGPVRDLILGRASPDLDIAVEDKSHEFGAVVAKEFGGRFVFHARFLSGSVLSPLASRLSPLAHIDITQTRAETYERPAVLPTVRPASIVGDLGRRDFTINSMALELTPGSFGAFIDPFDGRADVEQRRVRVLHARSFIDDPTRLFRCIRFAARLGFEIEPRTLELMRSAVEQRLPAFLTPERILYELRLICAEPLVLRMVQTLIRERVLEAAWRWIPPRGFLNKMTKLVRQAKSLGTVPGAGAPQSGTVPGFRPADLLFIYWLSVLPMTDRFPIRKEERDAAEAVAGFAKLRDRLRRKLKPSQVVQTLRAVPESALRITAVLESKAVSANIRAFLDNHSTVRIATTGADLRAAGLKPGPAYREILDKLLFARLDGKIRTVAEEREQLARLVERLGTRSELPKRNVARAAPKVVSVMSRARQKDV
jgi:tRNA nucleotidyltransferase (CCA-adding enzyme)